MSQYKTGTATVTNNSPTVTGTNTLWLANVTSGDSFTIAGDGVMYYVASVDTDTQVTLSAPYAGTTASGAVYAIGTGFTVPDSFPEMSQGDIETATIFTRAMRKIQGKFTGLVLDISGKAAIAGQTFTGGIAAPVVKSLEYDFSDQQFFTDPYIAGSKTGNAIAADQGGFAIRTLYYNGSDFVDIPNGQARSNTGWKVYWSTNKTIQFGSRAGNPVSSLISDNDGNIGIGTTTPAAALDVVGGISSTLMPQVGGDPIVESGSNADGEWAKWSDGTMTQFGTRTNSIDFTNAQGDFFRNFGSAMIITLPLTFFGTVADYSSSVQIGGADFQTDAVELIGSQQAAHITTSEIRAIFISQVSATETLTYAFQAIGRWK